MNASFKNANLTNVLVMFFSRGQCWFCAALLLSLQLAQAAFAQTTVQGSGTWSTAITVPACGNRQETGTLAVSYSGSVYSAVYRGNSGIESDCSESGPWTCSRGDYYSPTDFLTVTQFKSALQALVVSCVSGGALSSLTFYPSNTNRVTGTGYVYGSSFSISLDRIGGGVAPMAQSGWWWNANEGGRGYFIEVKNGRYFTASYLYDNSGNAIWYVSGPDNVSGSTLPGFLGAYSGGQTLTGTYKAPAGPSPVGSMSISFSDSTHGTITWPGGTVPITRYELGTGSLALPDPSFKPETGWWWNASEGGRGFSIEVQGDNLFIAGFMYDGGGNPVWYVSAGKMTTPTLYQGTWAQYQNGQAMGGPAKTASVKNANVGGVSISFSSTTTATLLLPDGRTLPLTRYPF